MTLFRFRSTIEKLNVESKRFVKNVKCGRHSGFKPCCVAWYSTIWQLIIKYPEIRSEYTKFMRSGFSDKGHPGYIACPKCCLKEDFVKAKDCDCGDKLRSAFGTDDKSWEKMSWKFVLTKLDW